MIPEIYFIAMVGILLSVYSIYVERKLRQNRDYKAACDLSNRMSCSRTFSTSYGKTLGISNGVWGTLFYLGLIGLLYFGYFDFVFYGALFGVFYSMRLAYILYVKLKNFCPVCSSIYLVNILLLIFSWLGL